jgi:TonB-dependent receptor
VLAGYAMGTLHWAEDVTTLLGVRAEGTAQSYEHQVSLEASDESYVNMLPSLHVTWRFRDGAQLRLALTSGLARPEYSRLLPVAVPFEGQILKGNPELVASRSYGGDLALEAYPGPLGLFSAGVFAKRILDPVVTRVSRQQLLGQTFETVEPVNGEAGTVSGVELAWVQQLAVLGLRPLRHFGLYSNYTYARSRVDYGDLRRGRHPLPKSPSHAGNVGLLYDNGTSGTALTVSANYRAPMLLRLEAQDRGDVWFEEELHVDLSVRQRLSAGWSLFLKLNNLTNEARRETFGDPRDGEWRRRKTERYGRYGVLGVSYGG